MYALSALPGSSATRRTNASTRRRCNAACVGAFSVNHSATEKIVAQSDNFVTIVCACLWYVVKGGAHGKTKERESRRCAEIHQKQTRVEAKEGDGILPILWTMGVH